MTDRTPTIDSMCIPITKIDEDDSAVIYQFSATIWTGALEHPGRAKDTGTATGTLAIDKLTGAATLLDAMPNDDGDKRYLRACRVLARHFADGDLPDRTMFACG
jgi:hypothetical protein